MKKLILFTISLILLSGCKYKLVDQAELDSLRQTGQSTFDVKQTEYTFKKKAECRQLCEPLYTKFEDQVGVLVPRYFYSIKDNTCYYLGGTFMKTGNTNTTSYYIQDCLSNEEVASYIDNNGIPTVKYRFDEYREMEKELMESK